MNVNLGMSVVPGPRRICRAFRREQPARFQGIGSHHVEETRAAYGGLQKARIVEVMVRRAG